MKTYILKLKHDKGIVNIKTFASDEQAAKNIICVAEGCPESAIKKITYKPTKIRTIDINAKEWFDKVNGNSYFSAHICINYGTGTQRNYFIPFQYGYGNHYIDMAKSELIKQGEIKINNPMDALWSYCNEHKIILRTSKKENCLKREL